MPAILTFCSVFSVRLGSIIVGALCLVQAAAMELACILGLQDVQSVSQTLDDFMYEKDLLFLTSFLNNVKKNPEPYLTTTLIVLIVYSFSTILLIYGALKLNAWLVMPFVALEFLRLCLTFAALVAGMLILKKNSLDLGPLMGGCTGGGFAMLLLLYLWACPLSLVQELLRRRREARRAGDGGGLNGVLNGVLGDADTAALEAKLWQQQQQQRQATGVSATRITTYPYMAQYPSYRGGYPIYIE